MVSTASGLVKLYVSRLPIVTWVKSSNLWKVLIPTSNTTGSKRPPSPASRALTLRWPRQLTPCWSRRQPQPGRRPWPSTPFAVAWPKAGVACTPHPSRPCPTRSSETLSGNFRPRMWPCWQAMPGPVIWKLLKLWWWLRRSWSASCTMRPCWMKRLKISPPEVPWCNPCPVQSLMKFITSRMRSVAQPGRSASFCWSGMCNSLDCQPRSPTSFILRHGSRRHATRDATVFSAAVDRCPWCMEWCHALQPHW